VAAFSIFDAPVHDLRHLCASRAIKLGARLDLGPDVLSYTMLKTAKRLVRPRLDAARAGVGSAVRTGCNPLAVSADPCTSGSLKIRCLRWIGEIGRAELVADGADHRVQTRYPPPSRLHFRP
jgi:hypothetical protein